MINMNNTSVFVLLALHSTMGNCQTLNTSLRQRQTNVMLERHNIARREVGVPDLQWSDKLVATAQAWANKMAETGTLKHSPGPSPYGENIAGTSAIGSSLAGEMVQWWVDEKNFFMPGAAYPDVSTTVREEDVVHYTQIVWRETTHVGCGLAQGKVKKFFVCNYSPAGNINGELPF